MTGTERFEHRIWILCTIIGSDVIYRNVMCIVDFYKPVMKFVIGIMFV
jgi:hypothetical protein